MEEEVEVNGIRVTTDGRRLSYCPSRYELDFGTLNLACKKSQKIWNYFDLNSTEKITAFTDMLSHIKEIVEDDVENWFDKSQIDDDSLKYKKLKSVIKELCK